MIFSAKRILLLSALAILVLSTGNFSFSYELGYVDGKVIKWTTNNPRFRASADSFPAGNAYRAGLDLVILRMNTNPSNFTFNLTHGDADVEKDNDQNEIWFSDVPEETGGYPAVAWGWYNTSTGALIEKDIVINEDRTWTPGFFKSVMTPYGGTDRPFMTTVTHELGHGFGLKHVGDEYNIMGQDWDHIYANWIFGLSYIGEDATNGMIALYGKKAANQEDLSVVHWRWTGTSDGGYSKHDRTRVFDNSGIELDEVAGEDEPRYIVDQGQTIKVEFTYENNGASRHETVDVGFYLSGNTLITTGDQRIGGRTLDLGRNSVYTKEHSVTLPSNLQPNQDYYIGAIVDENDEIEEGFWEGNNATYIGLRTDNFPAPTPTPIVIVPTLVITPPVFATPTPTPTRPIIIPTPNFTPIFKTPTPIIEFPTPIITPIDRPEIIIKEPILDFAGPQFEQRTIILPQTLSLIPFDSTQDNPPVLPEYRLGYVSSSSDHGSSVQLPDGSILTTANRQEDLVPYLIAISTDGNIHTFAKLALPKIQVGNHEISPDLVGVKSLTYNGDNRVDLLINLSGSNQDAGVFFEATARTSILGPFKTTSINNFMLHE